jgi:flagella basal body P-ring formation protein FlgA
LILRLSLFVLFFTIEIFATTVLVSSEAIKFEEKIDASKVKVQNISNLNKNCEPLTLTSLQNEEYITTHYINKNTVICTKDVKKQQNNIVVFNFGGVRIEKKGKIIFENNEFIKIKNLDGTIEQIYKDGRIK